MLWLGLYIYIGQSSDLRLSEGIVGHEGIPSGINDIGQLDEAVDGLIARCDCKRAVPPIRQIMLTCSRACSCQAVVVDQAAAGWDGVGADHDVTRATA